VVFDDDALNPHFSYLDERSFRHDIWFLDGVTGLNHMRAAQELGIKTFALWRLGGEDRTLWRIWDVPGDQGATERLKDVPPGQDVDMEGQGEIYGSKTGRRTARATSPSIRTRNRLRTKCSSRCRNRTGWTLRLQPESGCADVR